MAEILTAIGTILGIAATLFLRDWRDGKNLISKNIPPNTLDEGFKYMKHHYNDELTAVLTNIEINTRNMAEEMSKVDDKIDDIRVNGVRTRL